MMNYQMGTTSNFIFGAEIMTNYKSVMMFAITLPIFLILILELRAAKSKIKNLEMKIIQLDETDKLTSQFLSDRISKLELKEIKR
jgi:hypothetical protein